MSPEGGRGKVRALLLKDFDFSSEDCVGSLTNFRWGLDVETRLETRRPLRRLLEGSGEK